MGLRGKHRLTQSPGGISSQRTHPGRGRQPRHNFDARCCQTRARPTAAVALRSPPIATSARPPRGDQATSLPCHLPASMPRQVACCPCLSRIARPMSRTCFVRTLFPSPPCVVLGGGSALSFAVEPCIFFTQKKNPDPPFLISYMFVASWTDDTPFGDVPQIPHIVIILPP